MTASFRQPLQFGATLVDSGRTRFRLFAPAQPHVALELDGGPSLAMARRHDGWIEAEARCGAGTRYR